MKAATPPIYDSRLHKHITLHPPYDSNESERPQHQRGDGGDGGGFGAENAWA